MLPVPHASGRAAVGCCPQAEASATRRVVRCSSPRSASANAWTAQLVGDNETHARLLYTQVALGDTRKGSSPQDTPRGPKLKIVGNWQPLEVWGGKRRYARPVHPWNAQAKRAASRACRLTFCRGGPCILLKARLSSVTLGVHHGQGKERLHSWWVSARRVALWVRFLTLPV